MLAQSEKQGHQGVSLLSLPLCDVLCHPELIFPQIRGWVAVEHTHKGEDLISTLHRSDGDLWAEINERLQCEQRIHILR